MADLFAAVKAHDASARIMLVSKGRLGSSGQTPFAKGIFAFDKTKSKVSLGAPPGMGGTLFSDYTIPANSEQGFSNHWKNVGFAPSALGGNRCVNFPITQPKVVSGSLT